MAKAGRLRPGVRTAGSGRIRGGGVCLRRDWTGGGGRAGLAWGGEGRAGEGRGRAGSAGGGRSAAVVLGRMGSG